MGHDAYWPIMPVLIDETNSSADAWSLALGQALDALAGAVRVGVLNKLGDVVPSSDASKSRIYTLKGTKIESVYPQIVEAPVPSDGQVHVSTKVEKNTPWFNELQVQLENLEPIQDLSITLTIQRTAGVGFSGQYNTIGQQLEQSYEETDSAIMYTFKLKPNETLRPGKGRIFAGQTSGSGTLHSAAEDQYRVSYVAGGQEYVVEGRFYSKSQAN